MEKTFNTIVKADQEIGRKDYVIGMIAGIMRSMCGMFDGALVTLSNGNHQLTTTCEPDKYDKFSNMIERLYPGLCVFDA